MRFNHVQLLLSTVLAAVCFDPGAAAAHPDLWEWIDGLRPEAVRVATRPSPAGMVAVLRQPGRRLVLDLVPVALDATNQSSADGPGPGRDEAPRLYRGHVRGEDGSHAAVSIAAGRFGASVRIDGELLFVDAPDGAARTSGKLYRGDDPFAGPSQLKAAPFTTPGPGAAGAAVFVLDVAAVADFEFFTKFGGSTTAQMLAVLNLVDAIYVDQIDVTFDVTFTKVYDEMADPFSAFNSANLFNNYRDATAEFGALRDATGGDFEAAGLAHLFSDRNLNVPMGGKINAGFAFIDRLCDADQGVSLSTAPTVGTSLHAVIVAHEFGHSFGAPHDSEGACAGTAAGQFLMSPSATGNSFSACSKEIMTANRDEASCIDEQSVTTTTTTTTTQQQVVCGDATGDGKLLASDALRVLRAGVGVLECLLCICDADGSGTISAGDALRVLRASVSQPVELVCPAC